MLRIARREPSAILFAAQIAGVLLYPFMEGSEVGRDPTGERTWMELLFLSFTTLTSTGLSDVVPVKAFARGVLMIEQLAGLAYVAMVVSRLVALTVLGPRPEEHN